MGCSCVLACHLHIDTKTTTTIATTTTTSAERASSQAQHRLTSINGKLLIEAVQIIDLFGDLLPPV